VSKALDTPTKWAFESFFKWAKHEDSAHYKDATPLVRGLIAAMLAEIESAEDRVIAGLGREALLEAEIERLRNEHRRPREAT